MQRPLVRADSGPVRVEIRHGLIDAVCPERQQRGASTALRIGVLRGEGVGPELIEGTVRVLRAAAGAAGLRLDLVEGCEIGVPAHQRHGQYLTEEAAAFFQGVFDSGGAVMCGPGGGRFVYELRRRFGLYCKLAPIRSEAALAGASPLVGAAARAPVDIMVVRDNVGGVYQGQWSETYDAPTGRQATHSFGYSEAQVRRLVGAAARVACLRSRRLMVVLKDGGVPSITSLWRDVADEVCEPLGIEPSFINVDYAVYRMLERPDLFDTMVTPNLFGDIMADLGGVLLGSRGLCYSANYCPRGCAVYQTGHGSAHDLAGTDTANPVAQIQSMAMMLRESYGQAHAADLVERAVLSVFAGRWRTADLPVGGTVVGTQRMCDLIAERVEALAAGGA